MSCEGPRYETGQDIPSPGNFPALRNGVGGCARPLCRPCDRGRSLGRFRFRVPTATATLPISPGAPGAIATRANAPEQGQMHDRTTDAVGGSWQDTALWRGFRHLIPPALPGGFTPGQSGLAGTPVLAVGADSGGILDRVRRGQIPIAPRPVDRPGSRIPSRRAGHVHGLVPGPLIRRRKLGFPPQRRRHARIPRAGTPGNP